MDELKLGGKLGGGVYLHELSMNFSFKLPHYCSVFQAEIAAIEVALDLQLRNVGPQGSHTSPERSYRAFNAG